MIVDGAEQQLSPRDGALSMMYYLIEQANAAGFFKKLSDLDKVRGAFSIITTELTAQDETIKTLQDALTQKSTQATN